MKYIQRTLAVLVCLCTIWLGGCQTGKAPANAATEERRSMAPERVDVRGSIISSRYSDGQVVIEVEGIPAILNSRYDRAFVLVQPNAQIIDQDGRTLSINELRQGQNVAVLLRGGGRGNRVGIGVARKVWVEDVF